MYEMFPQELENWSLDTIDKLIPLPSIENERFDFKGYRLEGLKGIFADISAMANTSGGFLVLGVDENKDQDIILNYTKNGFESLKHKRSVENSINNALAQIDPCPDVEIRLDISEGNFFIPY